MYCLTALTKEFNSSPSLEMNLGLEAIQKGLNALMKEFNSSPSLKVNLELEANFKRV